MLFKKCYKRKGINMLELKNICFERDNKKILDNINLVIDTNKLVVVTGPNRIRKINFSKNYYGN